LLDIVGDVEQDSEIYSASFFRKRKNVELTISGMLSCSIVQNVTLDIPA